MSGVSSLLAPAFDVSAGGFRAAASDLGEVIAILSGGVRPDPETLSRLGLSMRVLQGFLLREAKERAGRDALSGFDDLGDAVLALRDAGARLPKGGLEQLTGSMGVGDAA